MIACGYAAATPVSALVHSSTLFTADVYLLIWFSPSFRCWLNIILLLVSGLIIFMAGLGANFDLRMIIALSTLRQLGLMIITISISLSGLAFFHSLSHALFKALLFICAGGVIHSIGDSQDTCFMGGLSVYNCIPFTSSSLMVPNFALCAMPFLAGFYFRDVFYEIFKYVWFLFTVCIYRFNSLLFRPFILFCYVW